jgi:hypothetical protein
MRMLRPVLATLWPLMLTSCAYSVHNVYVSGFEPETPVASGKVISSHAEQFVVLGFKTETRYMDRAYTELQEQCPAGNIVGIVTEHQTAMGFCSWRNHVYMKGLCVAAAEGSSAEPSQGPASAPAKQLKGKPAGKARKKS